MSRIRLIACFVFLLLCRMDAAFAQRARLEVGQRLPDLTMPSLIEDGTLKLETSDGQLVFTDSSGEASKPRAVVVFFVRYWPATSQEMVHLQKLHKQYGEQGLLVFAISLHTKPNVAGELTEELSITYPVASGHESAFGRKYGYAWPIYIADAGGVIRYTQLGSRFTQEHGRRYEQVIRRLLAQPR